MSLSIEPQYKWRQKKKFSGCHTFNCSSRTLMLYCASAMYLWLKLANVKVSESMLTYKPKIADCSRVLYSVTLDQKHIIEGLHFSASSY